MSSDNYTNPRDETEPPELDYGERTIDHFWVGDRKAIRHTRDEFGAEHWRFSHICTLARSGRVMRIAPLLQIGHGHEVLSTDPLHIEASILCEDCGTHGWVRDGRWVSA